ncbi:YitT family protein (plasmid) [Fibrella sp. ES10-3-2-2]
MSQRSSTTLVKSLQDTILIALGIASAGFGLKGFLLSSHFIDGGATGISMLLNQLTGLSLAILLPLINLPFIILAYRRIGRGFALRSVAAIAGLSLCLAIFPFPDVTPNHLLTAIFGEFFIGAGIGLAMRGGAVLDGTEALALLISRQSRLLKVSDVILLLNVVIFLTAARFLGVESALYSMLTYFAAFKTIDFVVTGIEQYTAVLFVSPHCQTIRQQIQAQGWGVTSLSSEHGHGHRGTSDQSLDALYVVVTRLEAARLLDLVEAIDEQAFISQSTLENMVGGKVKSMPLHG